ncbi:cytochrome c/ABC transporter substrate-binding protein [Sorangium sp. So ce1153]|uniref:cytochrome c/ABC transporter substrate-binding protein n=1 Tax=Sorangium sp. So ce1153 TaxID=3133333 RepID=UPI003F5EEE73
MASPRAWLGLLALPLAVGLCAAALRAPGGASVDARAHAAAPRARAAGGAACAELTPGALRGKRIYQRGATADGQSIEGAIADGAASLSGREAACAGCHGPSGQGTAEGGVEAPAIAPERLFATDRGRGPYTVEALAGVLREGRAPAGRRLHPVMPRYRLTDAELSDLADYLACVGRDLDPGVTEGSVALGAALPLTGPAAPVGVAVRDVLSAAFAEVNAQGGVYRRRLALRVEDSGGPAGEAGATARLLDRGVLALVGSVWSADPAVRARLSDERAPLVGPIGAGVTTGDDVVFHVQPGPDVLARVAVTHLADAPSSAAAVVLVVHTRDRAGEAWASGARREAERRGLAAPAVLSFGPGRLSPREVAVAARAHRARAVLFWGPGADLAGARAGLDDAGSAAPIYASLGSVAEHTGALPRHLPGRVLFLYAGPLGERARASGDALRVFLRRAGVAPGPLGAQASAYVAAQIAIEALKRTGTHATREELIAALERLRDFDAGPAPPVTFARNRRIGVLGASLVELDPATGAVARASAWIDVVP